MDKVNGGARPVGVTFGATMRNAVIGFLVAGAAALVAADARLFGIEAWKWALGLFGLWLFRSAARDSSSSS